MLAEVVELGVLTEERVRRRRHHDLPAVPARCDAGGVMDIEADVPLARQNRLAGVQPHPHSHGCRSQESLAELRRRRGVRRGAEDHEERVSLRVDLGPAVLRERLAEECPMRGEQVGIGGTVLVEEIGGALDVREEQGEGAGREVAHGR